MRRYLNINNIRLWGQYILSVLCFCLISFAVLGDHKSVRVGLSHMPPFSYVDHEKPRGFVVDLLVEIAKEERWNVEWVVDDWPVLLGKLDTHEIDLLPLVGYSEKRTRDMSFSQIEYLTVWGQVYTKPTADINNILDLQGKKIVTLKNGINGIHLRKLCKEFGFDCTLEEVNGLLEAYQLVAGNEVDGIVSSNLFAYSLAKQYGLRKTDILFDPFQVHIVAPKGEHLDLLGIHDEYMKQWVDDKGSIYYQARNRWVLDDNDQVSFSGWFWYIILGVFLFALMAVSLAIFFKRQVNRKVHDLVNRKQQLDQIINLVPHMIYVTDNRGKMLLANKNALSHFGMLEYPVEQINVLNMQSRDDRNTALFRDDDFMMSPDAVAIHKEVQVCDSQHNEKVLMLSKMPLLGRNDKSPAVLTVGVDITQAKQYEERIEYLAKYDFLTGLPNKILLEQHIDSALEGWQEDSLNGALLLIDIDDFKNINNAQGHNVGDEIIKEIGSRLKECIRSGDLVSRIGGDEFVIHLTALTKDDHYTLIQAEQIARVVHNLLKRPYDVGGFTYHLTNSIGVVSYPQHGNTSQILLQRADTSIYKAKEHNKNRISLFKPEFETQVVRQHALENALREAVDKEQLRLEYQPVVDRSKKTIGAEALVRWNRPGEGMISPSEFIEVAETSGLIAEIGDWVIDNVCRQVKTWIDQGKKDFYIAVNLSVNQIRDKNFYHKVEYLIQQYQIPHNYLEFEVTESLLMHESTRAINILNQLKLLGIRLSIDDFGTGYSSFSYLLSLPLDKLKIDRAFIRKIGDDSKSRTIVRTIVGMSKELGLKVVAEGVETEEQFQFLSAELCDYFQGYFFNKPLTADKLYQVAMS